MRIPDSSWPIHTLRIPGGLSAVTALLECSIDQGVSWFSIPATSTFYGTTVFTGDTAAIVANRYDVSGLFGSQMRWGFTAATGLTSCPVYALQRSICRSFSNLRQRCSRRVDVANCRQYRARYRVANQFAEGRIAMARGPTVLCCYVTSVHADPSAEITFPVVRVGEDRTGD
jgi:hypothetical protein